MKKTALTLSLLLLTGCTATGPSKGIVNSITQSQLSTLQPQAQIAAVFRQKIADVKELEKKSAVVSKEKGGQLTNDDLTIDIPADDVDSDENIEVSKVEWAKDADDESDVYEISSKDNQSFELDKPATITLKTDSNTDNLIPMLWTGYDWLPIEGTYDKDKKEITFKVKAIYKDIDEFYTNGGQEGKVDGPLLIKAGKASIFKNKITSDNKHFKVYYPEKVTKDYAQSIADYLEEAYDVYAKLKFNKPVTSIVDDEDKETVNYTTVYINNLDVNGNAVPFGYMGFDTDLDAKASKKKSTCYHELFHEVEFSYSGRSDDMFPDWFDEGMAASIDGHLPNEADKFDYLFSHFEQNRFIEPFTSTKDSYMHYYVFPFWSYVMKKYGDGIFGDIMKNFKRPYTLESCDKALKSAKIEPGFVGTYNDVVEDYYVNGTFFNKAHFANNMKNRAEDQPWLDITESAAKSSPIDDSKDYTLKPLSTNFLRYDSSNTNIKDNFKLTIKGDSSDYKVKIFYLNDKNGNVSNVGTEEITSDTTKTIKEFGSKETTVFLLMENTSLTSDLKLSIKMEN